LASVTPDRVRDRVNLSSWDIADEKVTELRARTKTLELMRALARKQGLYANSRRSFNNYLSDLIGLRYVRVERVKVRGNVRMFSVN